MSNETDRLNTALAGRYRILRHLGEGGMASVYLCEDIKHDRKVALKLLKPELAASPPRLLLRGAFSQAFSSWELSSDGRFLLLEGPPPMRATHLNVITNFPRFVEEKLRGTKPE